MPHLGRASRLEAKWFWCYLSRILVLGSLFLWAIGCGVQNPAPVSGLEFKSNLHLSAGGASGLLRNAQYLKIIGQRTLALEDLEEAHRLYPDNLKVTDALAHSYDEVGMGKRAQQVYQEALAREPDNTAMLNNLGFSYYLTGNWSQAEKCFRQILTRHPDDQTARNNLGLLLCREGRREEARKLWQEAEGEAVAAQRLRQALTFLEMAGKNHYAQPSKVKPRIASAPAPKPFVTKSAAAPALTAQTYNPSAGDRQPPPLASQKSKGKVQPIVGSAPKIVAATKPGKPNITPLAASHSHLQKETAGTASKEKLKVDRPKYLSARELMETKIAILNGNGNHYLAHETRSRLSLEGFNVVDIGNYRDFGVARTIIYYRPDAKHVATFLNNRFFPGAEVEPSPQLPGRIDVKVILGHDLPLPQRAGTSQTRVGESL